MLPAMGIRPWTLWALTVVACDPACGAITAPRALTGHADWQPWVIDVEPYEGISGLTVDGDGLFWAVPERQRALISLSVVDGRLRQAARAIPIEGLEAGTDTESIAWLEGRRFLLGSETQQEASPDTLWLIEIRDGTAVVRDRVPVDYGAFGLQGRANHGVEGLCTAGGWILAGIERVREVAGRRYAPVGVLDLQQRRWQTFFLELSSPKGKLAALTCRSTGDGAIEGMAVERHFGISRILRFRWPPRAEGEGTEVLRSTVIADLTAHLQPVPNFEGMAWHDDHLWLISDNHYGRRTGPTWGLRIPSQRLPPAAAATSSR